MIVELEKLKKWLSRSGRTKESFEVSQMLVKLASPKIPVELQGLFTDEELGLSGDSLKRTVREKFPNSIPPELQGLFTDEELGLSESASPAERLPNVPEALQGLFTAEELGMSKSVTSDIENKIRNEGASLRRGPKDEHTYDFVKKVQDLLQSKGYIIPGGADGEFGARTEAALRKFQRNNKLYGLSDSGEIDSITLRVLESSFAEKGSLRSDQFEAKEPEGKTEMIISPINGRRQLAEISEQTKSRLFKLTQAEVGGQGEKAQQAFMETVANRSAVQGVSIDYTVSDKRYYQPIMGPGKSVDTLPPVSESTRVKYNAILKKVIEGSNISNGATHNASGSVAKQWKTKFDGQDGTNVEFKGETFYSKTYEQSGIKELGLEKRDFRSPSIETGLSPSTGEYILPKFSFEAVPCTNAAALAIRESREVWDYGNISERDPRAEEPIQKYYKYTSDNNSYKRNIDRWGTGRVGVGKNKGKRQMNPVKERDSNGVAINWWHWSAVYVSWVMGQFDGEGAKWYITEGHAGYIRSYQRMRRKIEKAPKDYEGKMYYVWFSREDMKKYGLKPEPGDVVGRTKHCDIYIGNGMMIGGNTIAKNEQTGNKKKHAGGTSGPQPVRWKAGSGLIKRIKVTGPGSDNGREQTNLV